MSDNFRLPTLRLGTAFDEEVVPLDLPAQLLLGRNKAMAILDGADRAPVRLARMVRPVGLLGVKTSASHTAVRVRVVLMADELSARMWDRERRRATKEEPKSDVNGKVVVPNLSNKHRLVQVSAQGTPRALALLTWRHADGELTETAVEFEIGASEVGPSGLIMIDIDEPVTSPAWSEPGRLPGGVTGICVQQIELEEAGRPIMASVSTGRPELEERPIGGRNPGYFVVNPGSQDGTTRVVVTPHWADDERLRGKRAKVKHPVKFAREWNADRRVDSFGPATVQVVDADGNEVLEQTLRRSGGGYTFDLPDSVGPVYVRVLKKVGRGQPRIINWYVDVAPAQ